MEKTVRAFYSSVAVVSTIAVVCCMERSIYARSSKSSRAIPSQQKELESRIIRWLSEKERKGLLVGGIQIKTQALKFANQMKIEDLRLKFSDSDDQVFHF